MAKLTDIYAHRRRRVQLAKDVLETLAQLQRMEEREVEHFKPLPCDATYRKLGLIRAEQFWAEYIKAVEQEPLK